jgi:purine-cytosine permease-like protein
MRDFLKNLFSLEEEKNSIIVWCLVASICLGFWKTYRFGDFPQNLLILVQSLIVAVGAINVTKYLTKEKSPIESPVSMENESSKPKL